MIEPSESPAWPTTLRSRLRDGRLLGVDGSAWVYYSVPMAPVVDAKSPYDGLAAAEPLLAVYEELAAMTPWSISRRSVAKSNYRETHALLVNVPKFFEPDRSHPLAEYLRRNFGKVPTDRRVLLFGVKLKARVGGSGGIRAAIESVAETLVAGGTPLSDYDADTQKVIAAMERAGLIPASSEEIRLANAWWNHGDYPDTPMLNHADHLHFFTDTESVNLADRLGSDDCDSWGERGIAGQHAVSFASVQDLDLPFIETSSQMASWVADLVGLGALVVSVRGNVEPASITRDELRRQRKRYIDDINERAQSGKMERSEQQDMLATLEQVESMYAGGGASPTLAGASIVVGFDGQIGDIQQLVPAWVPAKLSLMAYRQTGAMAETMLCSNLRANPNLHDLPTQVIACSGIPSLNLVGDREGAVLGFTERDKQVAYLSPTAASDADSLPLFLCAGATGSGKTQVMLHEADQFSLMKRPVIIIDPKMDSDHSDVVKAAGGQVASLDELTSADGIFDPLRFAATKAVGVELAASLLMSVNPWGRFKDDMEVPLQHALSYGVDQGATCIGEALAAAALGIKNLPPMLVSGVEQLAGSSPMFRACVGVKPGTTGLRVAEGITLIKVGQAHLDLPEPGQPPSSLNQRIALALVRMMVFGSAMALTGRGGAVMLDEAWVFLGAGRSEVERLGRLARSQRVLPMLFTQRVTDAVNAGLSGYISRGLILPIEDREEAIAACNLFKIEPTDARLARITAKGTMGGNSAVGTAPNWGSMRALREPVDPKFPNGPTKVVRGAVGIYVDLAGRAIPVEIKLPQEFLDLSSTNPEDIRRRKEAQAAADAARNRAADALLMDPGLDAGGALVERIF